MDAVRRLPDVRREYAVGERQGGKQQADAFRRALGRSGDGAAADGGGSGSGNPGEGELGGGETGSGHRDTGESGGRQPGSGTSGGVHRPSSTADKNLPRDDRPPTPSRLQRQPAPGRREDVGVAHVDVYA
jgi:hypothetical protein